MELGFRSTVGSVNPFDIHHNTLYGNSSGIGIRLFGAGPPTIYMTNNAVYGFGNDFQDLITGSDTLTLDYNAADDADLNGTSNGQDIGPGTEPDTWDDAMTDPSATSLNSVDMTVVVGGPLWKKGIGSDSGGRGPTTDIVGNVRNLTTPSIGCWEFIPTEVRPIIFSPISRNSRIFMPKIIGSEPPPPPIIAYKITMII